MVNIFKGFNFLVKLSLSPGHYCLQKNQQKKKKHFIKFRGNKRVLSVPH